jgi:hypothetical protein
VETNQAESAPSETPLCSAKGCRQPAVWALLWRNPRIHGPERTKQWVACDEHRVSLADFLTRRDFPLEVVPL